MKAYIYQAALLCEPCALDVQAMTTPGPDSDDYPQGPFSDGGGEADSPQHCDLCGEFLQNPLTPEGVRYVQVADHEQWNTYYAGVL